MSATNSKLRDTTSYLIIRHDDAGLTSRVGRSLVFKVSCGVEVTRRGQEKYAKLNPFRPGVSDSDTNSKRGV
jgi:hypothetical protein